MVYSVYYYSSPFSFTGFYKQSLTNATAVKLSRENRKTNSLFYSLKSLYLFLHILYIIGVWRQTGRTKRIYKQVQQSTVLTYAHRLFRSIQLLRTHFQNWVCIHTHKTKVLCNMCWPTHIVCEHAYSYRWRQAYQFERSWILGFSSNNK